MNIADKQYIISQLGIFGCNGRESEVYMHCLKVGAKTVQEVARGMQRNRTTVYSEVEQLLKKGLLYETRKGKKRFIGAESPKVLHSLLQQRENQLVSLKSSISYAVNLLESIAPVSAGVPNVKLYEGVDGFKKMLEETLTATNEVLVFTNVRLFSELIDPEYLERYFQRRADEGIRTRLIFPPCDFATRVHKKAAEYKIHIRLLDDHNWQAGIFSWNDCLAIQSLSEGRLTCTIIENKDIAHFYRSVLFELAWAQAADLSRKQ